MSQSLQFLPVAFWPWFLEARLVPSSNAWSALELYSTGPPKRLCTSVDAWTGALEFQVFVLQDEVTQEGTFGNPIFYASPTRPHDTPVFTFREKPRTLPHLIPSVAWPCSSHKPPLSRDAKNLQRSITRAFQCLGQEQSGYRAPARSQVTSMRSSTPEEAVPRGEDEIRVLSVTGRNGAVLAVFSAPRRRSFLFHAHRFDRHE